MRLLLLVASLLYADVLFAQSPARTVYVVRHAEKADNSRDPELSERGAQRARALADALANAGIDGVVVTQFIRTRDTAAPTSEAHSVKPVIVAAGGASVREHAGAVADAVRSLDATAILVVGHSNTVPSIVAALGGPEMPEICDSQYSNLFVLVIAASGDATTAHARFGEPDPADPACSGAPDR